jgi:hypothetical protein
MVWKNTTQVGFGFTLSSNTIDDHTYNCVWIVARYKATGNIKGAFWENVLLPIDYPDWSQVRGKMNNDLLNVEIDEFSQAD